MIACSALGTDKCFGRCEAMARPQQNEFEISDGSITHKPTGHRLSFDPGSLVKANFEQGHEPRVLEFDAESWFDDHRVS